MLELPCGLEQEIADRGEVHRGIWSLRNEEDGTRIATATGVIAGITSNESLQSEGGIPFLMDLPIIGVLFKKSSKSKDKKDLIIFVTPHIIKRNISSSVSPASVAPAAAALDSASRAPAPSDTAHPAATIEKAPADTTGSPLN